MEERKKGNDANYILIKNVKGKRKESLECCGLTTMAPTLTEHREGSVATSRPGRKSCIKKKERETTRQGEKSDLGATIPSYSNPPHTLYSGCHSLKSLLSPTVTLKTKSLTWALQEESQNLYYHQRLTQHHTVGSCCNQSYPELLKVMSMIISRFS